MRATWPGARSGRSLIVTRPFLRSRKRVFSRSSAITIPFLIGPRPLLRVRRNLHADDLVRAARRLAAFDLVDIFHAGDDTAPHRILAVEEVATLEHNEELAVAVIRVLCPRHADRAALERLAREFGGQLGAGTAGTVAARVAGLGHEA